MQRLEKVAGDAGSHITCHPFLNPDEAFVILTEIRQLRATIKELTQASTQ